jgi:hypothetical protein
MAVPTTRTEFKEYCLRKLGKPVIEINVDDDQVDDRIDETLRYYWDYHFDGTEKIYYKQQITANNVADKYITLPENIIGAVRVFPIADPSIRSDDLFNIRYQIALNDLYSLTSVSMVPYYMAMEHLSLIAELLVGQQPIRYNRHKDRLYVDMNWNDDVLVGSYIIIDGYKTVNPEEFPDVWDDPWLKQYATQLVKRQWGEHLKLYEGMNLPGGITFNGQKIWDEANEEITKLEDQVINDYSLPVTDMIG